MNERCVEKKLQTLNTTADRALGGLQADRHLMLKIEKAAAQPRQESSGRVQWKPVLACAMALVLCFSLGISVINRDAAPILTAQPAGNGMVGNEIALNLPSDSVSINRSGAAPSYRSLWAEGSGTFPLIGVNGKYYRMLTAPAELSGKLLGSSFGKVAEFTTEPSLSGGDVLLSNVAAFGTEVYGVKGMENTFVAAEVNGSMRLFQRVSFNGAALRGSEKLSDTLQISGKIKAMELSGVGVITDSGVCQTLFDTMVDCASFESSGTVSGRQSLIIELNNGVMLQLAVRDENFSACGTWSCPEFFEAFQDAVK